MIKRSIIVIRCDGVVLIRSELGLAAIDRICSIDPCWLVFTTKEFELLFSVKGRAKVRCCAIAITFLHLISIGLHGVGLVWSIVIKHFLSQL